MTGDERDDDTWIWHAPRKAERSAEMRDLRADTATWVRRQCADLARAGHPDPLAAVQVEAAAHVRECSERLGEVDGLAVLRGAMEALGELMLTGAPTVVTLSDADATTPTITTDQGGPGAETGILDGPPRRPE